MKKKAINGRAYQVMKEGANYHLPVYMVTDNGLAEVVDMKVAINFVKGNSQGVGGKQAGTLATNVLSMLIGHLKELNVGDLRSRETSCAITKLEEGRMWLEERVRDREARNVLGTYQK